MEKKEIIFITGKINFLFFLININVEKGKIAAIESRLKERKTTKRTKKKFNEKFLVVYK